MPSPLRNLRIIVPAGVVVVAVVAWLAFGYFGFQTILFDDEVDEALPVFTQDAVDRPSTTVTAAPTDDEVDGAPATTTTTTAPEIVTLASGSFVSRSHPGEGEAVVITDGSSTRFLRFEDFSTDNGPDLNVYLTSAPADADASAFDDDFVDLGDLKGNVGNQNYEIPADVDLDRYSTVVVWCVRFAVVFTAADLAVV